LPPPPRLLSACPFADLEAKKPGGQTTLFAAVAVADFFYPEHRIAAECTSSFQNRRRIIGFLSSPRGVTFVVAKI
jgi:hypothetical protein